MFNLEQSIIEWRRQMESAGVKNSDILDELESHLREDWSRKIQSGQKGEQAFENAVRSVGQASALKHEFGKLPTKWAWLRKLQGALAGALVPVPSLILLTPNARLTLEAAEQEAPLFSHPFVGTEHVLLGLLAFEKGTVPNMLKNLGVNPGNLKQRIESYISDFPLSRRMPERLPYTPRVKESLRFAAAEAKNFQHAFVGAEHIFLGLLLEKDGVAGRVLRDAGLTPERIRQQFKTELGWSK